VFGDSTVTSINTIGVTAFSGCRALTKIDLGNITQIVDDIVIGDNAFNNVPASGEIWAIQKQVVQDFYTGFVFGAGIKGIASGASGAGIFQANSALNNPAKPKVIEFSSEFASANGGLIGNYAFTSCSGITAIGIQKSDTTYALSIGTYAFQNCTNLTKIAFIEDAVEIPSLSIGTVAFDNCQKLADFAGASANSIVIDAIANYTFSLCPNLTYDMIDKIKSVVGTTKVQDTTGFKKFIYFKPDNNAIMLSKGCLAYGEIES
jgi:hypothetical protein